MSPKTPLKLIHFDGTCTPKSEDKFSPTRILHFKSDIDARSLVHGAYLSVKSRECSQETAIHLRGAQFIAKQPLSAGTCFAQIFAMTPLVRCWLKFFGKVFGESLAVCCGTFVVFNNFSFHIGLLVDSIEGKSVNIPYQLL